MDQSRLACPTLPHFLVLSNSAIFHAGCVAVPERPLMCPLQGLLTSELLCCHCHYLVSPIPARTTILLLYTALPSSQFPSKYECFDSLSLSISPALAQVSLHVTINAKP